MSKDVKSAIAEFYEVVNMTPKEIESWLETEESQAVGQKKDDDESTGHKSGRRIIELLQKKENEYTDDDISHMKKVIIAVLDLVRYIQKAQKPLPNWNFVYLIKVRKAIVTSIVIARKSHRTILKILVGVILLKIGVTILLKSEIQAQGGQCPPL